jgi:pimeloyl-ACP methyl ester carboxylesterase
MDARPNIVLVHGAWADGSCWSGVIERLQSDGYHVTAPQFPMTALADQAIPPDAERLFARRMGATAIEVPSSHVAMVSHPDEVTRLITTAAQACATPAA